MTIVPATLLALLSLSPGDASPPRASPPRPWLSTFACASGPSPVVCIECSDDFAACDLCYADAAGHDACEPIQPTPLLGCVGSTCFECINTGGGGFRCVLTGPGRICRAGCDAANGCSSGCSGLG